MWWASFVPIVYLTLTKRMTKRPVDKQIPAATLYRLVYGSLAVRVAVFCATGFLAALPVIPIHAMEPSMPTTTTTSSLASELTDEVVTVIETPNEVVNENQIETMNENDVSVVNPTAEPLVSEGNGQVPNASTEANESNPTIEAVLETSTNDVNASSSTPASTETSSDLTFGHSGEESAGTELVGSSTAATVIADAEANETTPPVGQNDTAEINSATSSDSLQPAATEINDLIAPTTTATATVLMVSSATTDDHFNRADCIAMGGGAYQCFDRQELLVDTTNPVFAVYAAPDSDGDTEIYVRRDANTVQLSNNQVDDTAPAYDPLTDSYIWQRAQDDGSVIVLYNDGQERVLSQVGVNSIEPSYSDGVAVWQAWLGGNWEIVMADDGHLTQITTSPEHDIAPSVQAGYVTWNIVGTAGQTVGIYNIATKQQSSINDPDVARTENPRLVMVYDATYENGDVITKGFNPETGEVITLAAQPAPEPLNIPASEQTGQTRALIQGKSTNSRDDLGEQFIDPEANDTASSTGSTPDLTTGSSTQTGVATSTPDLTVTVGTTSAPTLPLTDFDIIVEPFGTSSPTTTPTT